MPYSSLPAGSPAFKLWEKVHSAAKAAGDDDETAAKKSWGALKNAGFEKVDGKWIKTKALVEFSMAMMKGADMRWRMTASDTKKDAYDERMTLPLYRSFIDNINSKKPVPEAFKFVTSDYWKGGMPYVSISHYPDLNGFAVPGIPETVYIDGETFKGKGKFFDTRLGRKCYQSLSENDSVPDDKKVRVSIAFLDLAHQHGDGPVFKRNSLSDICSQCENEVGDKKYLDGYLVQLAMTRVPVNKRSSMEVEKSMTTRKQDAESIIDPELAEELEKKALLIGKSVMMVEFADTDDPIEVIEAEEQVEGFVEGDPNLPETDDPNPPEPIVEEADLEKARAAQKARSSKYGIAILAQGHVTKPGQWSSVPDSQWGDPVNYRYPMPDDAHVRNAASRFGQEKGGYRGKGVVGKRIARKEKSKGIGEKAMTDKSEPSTLINLEEKSEVAPPITIAVETVTEDQLPPRINPQVWVQGKGQEALDLMFVELNRVLDDIFLRPDVKEDMRKSSVQAIFEDLKNYVGMKPSMIAEPLFALVDAVVSAKSMIGTDEEKLTSVQPALNALGEAIKTEVAPPKPVDPKDEAIATLSQSIEQLREDMAIMRSQITQPQPRITQPVIPTVIPKPRSASPALVRELVQRATTKPVVKKSSVADIVFTRAGLTPPQ